MKTLEMEKLKEAFEVFYSASEQLSLYYQKLEERVKVLGEELQQKNRLLEAVFGCMGEPLIVLDSEGRVRLFNARAAQILGHDLQEGLPFQKLGIAVGKEIKIADGWFIAEMFGIDTTGGWVVLLKDITLVKEMEQERQNLKRLEAMGNTLATVVHELRNPLCSIELYASMLLQELEGGPLEALAKGISEGVRSLDTFLSNALYFAKPRKPRLQKVVLRDVVEEVLQILSPLVKEEFLKLEVTLSEAELHVDKALIKQVFLNIILNAIQAMEGKGSIFVQDEEKEDEYLVKIRDTGPGIEETDLERIFDPFFTTKQEGTGLGLSISLKIMQAHGGGIRVKSRPGQGTEFVLYFPSKVNLQRRTLP